MLELARGVSHWAHGFKSSVIFLFNTGEEEGLNGAHSFITQVSFICSCSRGELSLFMENLLYNIFSSFLTG